MQAIDSVTRVFLGSEPEFYPPNIRKDTGLNHHHSVPRTDS